VRTTFLLLLPCLASLAACPSAVAAPPAPPAYPSTRIPPVEMDWEGLPERPPVPEPSRSHASSDMLGDVWEGDEENQWQGTWIRRGRSAVFDAYWVHPTGERVLAVVTVTARGRHVEVSRRHPGGQGCTYWGIIAANRVDVAGSYECSWHRHTSPWRAKIIRMPDVSPAVLSRRDRHD
jgi:hypothetical protein